MKTQHFVVLPNQSSTASVRPVKTNLWTILFWMVAGALALSLVQQFLEARRTIQEANKLSHQNAQAIAGQDQRVTALEQALLESKNRWNWQSGLDMACKITTLGAILWKIGCRLFGF